MRCTYIIHTYMLSLRFMVSKFSNAWFPFLVERKIHLLPDLLPSPAHLGFPQAPQPWDICCCSPSPIPEPTHSLLHLCAPISEFQTSAVVSMIRWKSDGSCCPTCPHLHFAFPSSSSLSVILALPPTPCWAQWQQQCPLPQGAAPISGLLGWHTPRASSAASIPSLLLSAWAGGSKWKHELLTTVWAVKDQEFLFMRTPACVFTCRSK